MTAAHFNTAVRQIVTNWYFSTLQDYKEAPVGHLHGAGAENEGGVGGTKRLWEIRSEPLEGSNGRSETQTATVAAEGGL